MNITAQRSHFFVLYLMSLAFLGCTQKSPSPAAGKTTVQADATPVIVQRIDTIYAMDNDTTITVVQGKAIVKGHIIANTTHPRYEVNASKGQIVTALLKPSKKGGNVRINQIQKPGGSFDGPFGDSVSYTFNRDGNIDFIIGENMMAGDPYTGDFILNIFIRQADTLTARR